MKMTETLLSIPPYISAPWKNIVSLHMVADRFAGPILIIELITGNRIEVPNLTPAAIEAIFAAHARYLEPKKSDMMIFPLPGNMGGLDQMTALWQHNPEQAGSPDLPPELLDRVVTLSKNMGLEDSSLLPQPEPNCNCPFCQIAKSMHKSDEQPIEEQISDEDLKFRTWDIKQESDQLYTVSNPLDEKEHFRVFLGNPVGCTCGQKACEHIEAVLKS
jgi:hypothetical protein